MTRRPLFAVSLVDRQTGQPHRIGRHPLTMFTRDPGEAAEELMRNRDPDCWRIDARAFVPGLSLSA